MARPRAVSQADMNRALDCLARAGITLEEVIIEPGRVRLWGVQAPPLDKPGGIASRDYLRRLIAGKPLSCEMLYRDRYDRRVMRCALPDGSDLSCRMVGAGHARDWPRYSGGAYAGCEK